MFRSALIRKARTLYTARDRTKQRTRRTLVAVLALATLTAGAGCGNGDGQPPAPADTAADRLPPAGGNLSDRVMQYPTEQRDHVLGEVSYETNPPTGGDHFPFWHNCFFYTVPVMDEVAVHSLEHGAVWVAYRPDTDTAVLDAIRESVASETHLLASPYPGLEAPLVLSAWERQMTAEDWDDPAVEAFIWSHSGRRSPTAPEAGASCEQAVGEPDDPAFRYEEAVETYS